MARGSLNSRSTNTECTRYDVRVIHTSTTGGHCVAKGTRVSTPTCFHTLHTAGPYLLCAGVDIHDRPVHDPVEDSKYVLCAEDVDALVACIVQRSEEVHEPGWISGVRVAVFCAGLATHFKNNTHTQGALCRLRGYCSPIHLQWRRAPLAYMLPNRFQCLRNFATHDVKGMDGTSSHFKPTGTSHIHARRRMMRMFSGTSIIKHKMPTRAVYCSVLPGHVSALSKLRDADQPPHSTLMHTSGSVSRRRKKASFSLMTSMPATSTAFTQQRSCFPGSGGLAGQLSKVGRWGVETGLGKSK